MGPSVLKVVPHLVANSCLLASIQTTLANLTDFVKMVLSVAQGRFGHAIGNLAILAPFGHDPNDTADLRDFVKMPAAILFSA